MSEPTEPNGTQPTLRERGLAKMEEVYGTPFQDYPSDHFAMTADHLFANVWSRPGLSIRDRRLVLLGALTAQGLMDTAAIQIGAALRNGELTEEELHEIALFLCHYIGWPNGSKLDISITTIVGQQKKAARDKQKQQESAAEPPKP
ncbi:carboxymuconolactone decarboxylase family protein [Nocardia cyriacigeorgica]|uniref:carboxymuconolactone decarboxylase family protein n=1 Tax=Nocardia cyriacigeorgica TaxID=135487 RepID=UPI001895653E|nr:carboxymuconolactone decarboxylase family protein [Nocardia cyriacigeorgica]MBF6436661.1 carboxymuconolactone decarboxylase family protein [Nocardia cyriacigeorgica]MBF6452230.1 carboxymuconolactone decarboxylase family protein [Nocardia cyriacigeorgica]MBF6480140.1 carboxymuconolactone decarboxylase family protein [Nocardia cyriacigeorgica]MBF6549399.1 carboxymuconolactone decarboxylase family protein [Nocardia cyriacigeorgica]